ncbi:MAG: hypothetical protein ABIE74_09405 [Pseudomonadota bacterium]
MVFFKPIGKKELEEERPSLRLPLPPERNNKEKKNAQEEEEKTEKLIHIIELT